MNMRKMLKFVFLAAVVAVGINSPVLAARWSDGRNAYGMTTRDGLNAYGMVAHDGLNGYTRVPHQDLNSPLLDGGGSSGYNAEEKLH
jgi:hypothetical protein